jgi:hypothetical protein
MVDLVLRLVSRYLAIALVLCVSASPADAQESSSRVELGAQAALIGITEPVVSGAGGVLVDVNLSRILAIEGRSLWIDEGPSARAQLSAGVRATFIRRPKFSIYGVALPGRYYVPSSPVFFDRSHFALDLDLGIAFPIARSFVGRVEVDRDIHAFPSTAVPPDALGRPMADIPGQVGSRWNLSVVLAYGVGQPVPRPNLVTADGRWTVGPQFGVTIATSATPVGTFGGFISCRLSRLVDIDGTVSTSITGDLPAGLEEGGRLTQAVAGIKVGVREGQLGVFFKFRGGVNSWANTRVTETEYERATHPAYDLGGVIEYSITKATLLRLDVGESVSIYRQRVPSFEGTFFLRSGPAVYTLPMSVGLGLRF